MKINHTFVKVRRGSLLEQDVQIIVNAANEDMRGGGGIDGLIHVQAGPRLLAELRQVAPKGAKTGEAVLTQGHGLKQPYILHTSGPVWNEARATKCAQELRSCYQSCLEKADAQQFESIAFCSISTGIYGYPIEQAAPLAVTTVIDFLHTNPKTSLQNIVFAMYGAEEFRAFEKAMRRERDEHGRGGEEIELTDEDDAILSDCWAKVARTIDEEKQRSSPD